MFEAFHIEEILNSQRTNIANDAAPVGGKKANSALQTKFPNDACRNDGRNKAQLAWYES